MILYTYLLKHHRTALASAAPVFIFIMVRAMIVAVALLGLVVGSQAGAVDLSPKNFDKEVLESGKSAFIKFLAPW